jgi:hypothetical protein
MLLAHLRTPTTSLPGEVGYPGCSVLHLAPIQPIQSFIAVYVAKLAIISSRDHGALFAR